MGNNTTRSSHTLILMTNKRVHVNSDNMHQTVSINLESKSTAVSFMAYLYFILNSYRPTPLNFDIDFLYKSVFQKMN
jgi:hypothetical protein